MDNFDEGIFIDVPDFEEISLFRRKFRFKFNDLEESEIKNVFFTHPFENLQKFNKDIKEVFDEVQIIGDNPPQSKHH